jgi:signal transduction histidine kinase
MFARVVWLIVALVCLSLFIWGLPQGYRVYVAFEGDTLPPPGIIRAGLAELGIHEGLYVLIRTSSMAVVALFFIATGVLIFLRRPDERPALLFSLQLLLFGAVFATGVTLSTLPRPLLLDFVLNLTFISFFFSPYLLPDGRFVPRWTRWLVILLIINTFGVTFFEGTPLDTNTWTPLLTTPFYIMVAVSSIAAMVYRYRYVSNPVQRQQIKWIVYGLVVTIFIFFAYWTPVNIIPALTQMPRTAALYDLVGGTISILSFALLPLALGIAILRYRLWDIDPLVNRTLVYAALSASVIGIYAMVVGYFSAFFQVRDDWLVSLLAAAIVAVLFQPLRERLQRGVNRLMYGRRDDPYDVISGLGRRLEATLSSDAVLPTIVTTVREALKLPYAAITLRENNRYRVAAEDGSIQEILVRLPIISQSGAVGELVLAPRTPGENFSSTDRRLLGDLVRQAGMAIHTALLTQNLQCLNEELQQARTQLVTAREEERRRLARDLHDGFGSILASLNLRAGAIRSVLNRDPRAADALAAEQQETIRATIADVRRLIHNLRPPVLNELGLSAALAELVSQHSPFYARETENDEAYPVQIMLEITKQLPHLPAAVEVAAYRIVQEALTNVIHHSRSRFCWLRLSILDGCLQVEVVDDGAGLPEVYEVGVGIISMRERAAELGGYCAVGRVTGGGTRVLANLPLGVLK